ATAADAADGNPDAAQKLTDLDQAASSGDASAQRAMSVITQAFSTAADNADGGPPTTSGGLPWVPFTLGAAAGIGGYAWWRHYHARKAKRAAATIEHPEATPPVAPPPAPAAPTSTSGVGASIWQMPGGIVSEIERIDSDFSVFASEFDGFLKIRGYPAKIDPSLRPLVELFEFVWMPLLQEWRVFLEKHHG